MSYDFQDILCKQIWDRASPKGQKHIHAFAWRESPAGLEKVWYRLVSKKTQQEKEEFVKKIMLAAEAQERYRKEAFSSGQKPHRPKGIAVWMNAGDWGADIGSHAELKKKLELKNCKHCSEPVHGPRFDVCAYHYTNTPEQKERVKSTLKELEMLPKDCDSKEEWIKKQLEFARKNIRRIGNVNG